MKKSLFFLAASAVLVSCMQENRLDPPQPHNVTIVAGASDTKTVLDGNAIKWEGGDEIALVFTKGNALVTEKFIYESEEAPAETAEFTGTLQPEASEYEETVVAVYPSEAVSAEGEISFSVPETQEVRADGSFVSKANLSSTVLSLEDILEDGKAEASFHNALAVLRFTLPADVKSVTFTGTAPLAGKAPLSLMDDGRLGVSEDADFSEGVKAVSLKLAAGAETFDENVTYNLLVWPGEHASLTVRMTDKDDCVYEKTVKFDPESPLVLAASQYRTLDFNENFVKSYTLAATGFDLIADDRMMTVFASCDEILLEQEVTAAAGDNGMVFNGSLTSAVAHGENISAFAVYPSSVYNIENHKIAYSLPFSGDLSPLYTAVLDHSEIVSGSASAVFTSVEAALAKLSFTLLAGISTVKVASTVPFAGVAEIKVGVDGKPVAVSPDASEIVMSGAEGECELNIFPIEEADITFTFTDADGCSVSQDFSGVTVAAGEDCEFDLAPVNFDKSFVLTLTGREWTADDDVKVVLASDESVEYAKALNVTMTDGTATASAVLGGQIAHKAAGLKGYAVYPAAQCSDDGKISFSLSSVQAPGDEFALYSAALAPEELVAGTSSAAFVSALSKLEFTLPDGISKVEISASEALVGSPALTVSDGSFVLDRTDVSDGNSVTLEPSVPEVLSAGSYSVTVWPGTYTGVKVVLTDNDDCTTEVVLGEVTVEAGASATLELGAISFTTPHTINTLVEGPIKVIFGDEATAVELTKSGSAFTHESHVKYSSAFAYYPAEIAIAPAEQTAQTAKPELYSAELTFDGDHNAAAEFTNAFATLTITVPDGTTKVTLTSDTPLAGTMKVDSKEVIVDETAAKSETLTITGITGTTVTAYVLPNTHASLMAAIEDADGNTAKKDLTEQQTFAADKTSEIDLSDLTFYVLKVGDYVYADGTMGTSYKDSKGNLAAGKIFWINDGNITLSGDNADYTRGLAYAIGDDGKYLYTGSVLGWGNIGTSTGLSNSISNILGDNKEYADETVIRGFSNTKKILEIALGAGFTRQSFWSELDMDTPAAVGTTPWYIPSAKEIDLIKNSGVNISSTVWTSTLNRTNNSYMSLCPIYNPNISYNKVSYENATDTSSSSMNIYFKIFAF